MIVVADASPLIFLAKLDRLDLVFQTGSPSSARSSARKKSGDAVHISTLVQDEIQRPDILPDERRSLEAFLARCQLHPPSPRPRAFAASLSRADNATLALAIRLRAHRLLADDRILRAMAEAHGIRPLGTLGLLLGGLRSGKLSTSETRQLLDALVSMHGFRISIPVYQSALAFIQSPTSR